MAAQNYSLKVESLNVKQAQLSHLKVYENLTSISLDKIQQAVLLAVDQNAPRFPTNQAPVADNKLYKDNDGQQYYRPNFRLATRTGQIPGPAVRFLKDADDNVRLHIELEEVPSNFDDACPLTVHVEAVSVVWTGGKQSFPKPTIFFDDEASSDRPRITIRAGADIPANLIDPLYKAMQQQATLELSLSYGYWVQQPSTRPRKPRIRDHRFRPNRPTIPAQSLPWTAPILQLASPVPQIQLNQVARIAEPVALAEGGEGGEGNTAHLLQEAFSRQRALHIHNAQVTAETLQNINKLEREKIAREKKENYKKETIKRTLNFVFDANLKQNAPIYTILRADEDSLQADWVDTQFGFIRQATFANTIYRLPDELRLAFNPELGLPHLIPQLYRDAEENVRVRVTLRMIPHHDPAKLSALRDFLYRDSAGGLANPSIIVGGYEKATLKLTTAFPEEISFIEGDEIEISLEGGMQMTLDLSLAYYRHMAELMTTPIGISGVVTVTLPPREGEETGPEKRIPMRLVLNALAGITLETRVVEETLSPTTIEISNPSNATIQLENYVSRLLQVDRNSVVPLAIFQATNKTPVPIVLAPAETTVVEVTPTDADDVVWNAMHLALLDPGLTQNATDVLDRIHEVAPSGSLNWDISIECPPLRANALPAELSSLYRVVVEVSREGYAPQRVTLGKETPEESITMQRSLKDILGKEATGLPSFSYRVQNIYVDREGAWSEAKSAEGNSLFIFPNRDDG